MKEKQNAGIDLLKIIACVCVVTLHVIQNGDGRNTPQLCVYLLGTFGIPLFYLINGYLLQEKEFTWEYTCRKIKKIILFVIMWGGYTVQQRV